MLAKEIKEISAALNSVLNAKKHERLRAGIDQKVGNVDGQLKASRTKITIFQKEHDTLRSRVERYNPQSLEKLQKQNEARHAKIKLLDEA
jgi:hypothetical protein